MLVPLTYLLCFGFPLLQVRSPPSAGTGEGGGSTLHLYEQQKFLLSIFSVRRLPTRTTPLGHLGLVRLNQTSYTSPPTRPGWTLPRYSPLL